ncbi:DUF4837 family protein [Winogradskyella immobilis]|uniref:DUF4837 family protein n=1 Tax=Winogradskyella immobilis TaxID=2816852 RepID=A0ABS8EJX9_9FLAO|nr:DUF4837 family protein [Winogradskyella immobilis]MCC1483463.1 DUF4837 family protein [Winogradskyella immobilis]MCG0015557.1 DUF4837 family protein [Winogradskyella immobilis]
MKNIFSIACLIVLLSCGGKSDNVRYLANSTGNINNVSIVADNLLWEGRVGEAIREVLTAPLPGLPTDEPIFSLRQIPTQVFDGFATSSRSILKIEKIDDSGVSITRDVYARPQTVVVIKGKTDQEIIDQLNKNSAKIIDAFNKEERREKLRRINKSLLKDEAMETALGITVDIPSIYKIAKAEDNFYWLRKNLGGYKTMDLMFYYYPLDAIKKGDSTIVDIINMRDTIIKERIPGEDDIIMTTRTDYAPALFDIILDNKPAYETKGMWEIKGAYMGGPFVNYAIEDKINNRYLVAEGYVYAPSQDKRENIFELEAIIKSIKIN